jgi:hypothetical protein
MQDSRESLIEILKQELQFLEQGGYRKPPQQAWRGARVFEDSPTCLNYQTAEQRGPCSECVLMQFVPPDQREKAIPCQHIPLTERGDTLHSIYAWGTQEEIEQVVGDWLRSSIRKLEDEQKSPSPPR